MTVTPLRAADTRPLRQRVLRPTQAAEELVYDGDDDPRAVHLGVLRDGEVVAIASVYPQPHPEVDGLGGSGSWRLRGMAVAPELQGSGLGSALLTACFSAVAAAGGDVFWCNARVSAQGFYERHGLATVGPVFDVPPIGMHTVMFRAV